MTGDKNPDQSVSITLSRAQVNQVAREASDDGSLSVLFQGTADAFTEIGDRIDPEDRRLSRSLLLGLAVLAAVPLDGTLVKGADIARRLKLNISTTHRYLSTLAAIDLLERDPSGRGYRRVK